MNKSVKLNSFFLVLFCIVFGLLYLDIQDSSLSISDVEQVQRVFDKKEQKLQEVLDELLQIEIDGDPEQLFFSIDPSTKQTITTNKIAVGAYKDGYLRYWSDNEMGLPEVISEIQYQPIVKLKNGIYSQYTRVKDNITYVSLFVIQHDYAFDNNLLPSTLQEDFGINGDVAIINPGEPYENERAIYNIDGKPLFELGPTEIKPSNQAKENLLFITYLVVLIFLLNTITNVIESKEKKSNVPRILFIVVLLSIRGLFRIFDFNILLGKLKIFNSLDFQLFSFASLGEFMIDSSIILYAIYYLNNHIKIKRIRNNSFKTILFLIAPVAVLFTYFCIDKEIGATVLRTPINFNIEQLFNLDLYTLIGMLLFGILAGTCFAVTRGFSRLLKVALIPPNRVIQYYLIVIFSGIALNIGYDFMSWAAISFMAVTTLSVYYFEYKKFLQLKLGVTLLFVGINALFISTEILFYGEQQEKNDRLALAKSISSNKDEQVERDFFKSEKKLIESGIPEKYLTQRENNTKLAFNEEVDKLFHTKDWDIYEKEYFLFDSDSNIVWKNKESTYSFKDIQALVAKHGIQSAYNPQVQFIHDNTDRLNYIITLPIVPEDSLIGYFCLTLKSNQIPDEIGFPLLLSDKSTHLNINPNYSVARYYKNDLIQVLGDYNYPLTGNIWNSRLTNKYRFYSDQGYNHLVYLIDRGSLLVISNPEIQPTAKITTFAYVLAFYILLFLIGLLLRSIQFSLSVNLAMRSLNTKIQTGAVALVIITLVLFGIGSTVYFIEQHEKSSQDYIEEKIHSVNTELHQKFKKIKHFRPDDVDYYIYLMEKFSKVFRTDLNLYTPEGILIASSRSRLFYYGLLTERMNADAFLEIKLNNKNQFIHTENIGELSYLSGYTPFFDRDGKVIAYLNVAHFAKQDQVQAELSSFYIAVINIFVLLLLFTVVVALAVSRWITDPIKKIQAALSSMDIRGSYATINYTANDEIGKLVQEYNTKVEELKSSVKALAQTERESAWREMARQVAHEIKNPLTPMKLSIQHLERQLANMQTDDQTYTKRVISTLLEQIDNLAFIANSFSDFATLTKKDHQDVDLTALLEHIEVLYKESTTIVTERPNYACIIDGNKEQLLQVINNLIKNAIQAIPEDRKPVIQVILENRMKSFKLTIKDNGTGIPDLIKANIFSPNFTTKGTGSGLGLAISKSIIQAHNASISFETEKDTGTSFFLEFPKK